MQIDSELLTSACNTLIIAQEGRNTNALLSPLHREVTCEASLGTKSFERILSSVKLIFHDHDVFYRIWEFGL